MHQVLHEADVLELKEKLDKAEKAGWRTVGFSFGYDLWGTPGFFALVHKEDQ